MRTCDITLLTDPKRRRILQNFECLLTWVGCAIISVFLAALIGRAVTSHAEVALFHVLKDSRATSAPRGPNIDFSLWSPQRIADYRALGQYFDFPLAVLRISRIGIEAPILEGTDDSVLNRGLGHISGTALPGQEGTVGIAGHRDSFFRALKDIAVGDMIQVEGNDHTYQYHVTELLVVDPANLAVLQPRANPSLTLVTCYPFYFVGSAPKRYIVQASLDSAASSKQEQSN